MVVVAPTKGCGSLPVVRCTLHSRPDAGEDPPGAATLPPEPPEVLVVDVDAFTCGDGPAEVGPMLLGVRLSFCALFPASCAAAAERLGELLWAEPNP